MLLADIYRLLSPEEPVIAGDQWSISGMFPDIWAPCELFVGRRVREIIAAHPRLLIRRLICHEVTP